LHATAKSLRTAARPLLHLRRKRTGFGYSAERACARRPRRKLFDLKSSYNHAGTPYVRIFLEDGVLKPGQEITQRLTLRDPKQNLPPYSLQLLSGQGQP